VAHLSLLAALHLGIAAAAQAQDCSVQDSVQGIMPVTSMWIRATSAVANFPNNCACAPPTSFPCYDFTPPVFPPCSAACGIEDTRLGGVATFQHCPTWVQYPGESGFICHPAQTGVHWDQYGFGGGTSPTNAVLTIEAVFVMAEARRVQITGNWTQLQGGESLASAPQFRYYRAGESVVLAGVAGGKSGTLLEWKHGWCADTNVNGICDEYENAARNFGDFDASGDVGAPDLALLLSSWGTVTAPVRDLDGDGVIGASDLGILLSRWGLGA
jgi:hypothetical protein